MTNATLTAALCIICHDRPVELTTALDAASTDAWDQIVVLDMASDPPLPPRDRMTWLRSDENLGVTSGRNLVALHAHADVLVFLDDDALPLTPVVQTAISRFQAQPRLAVLAFLVQRPGGNLVSSEQPFRGRSVPGRPPQWCSYFLGGAHAIRRSALEEAGGYDEAFFYSTEEVDLAFTLLRLGWHLYFEPAIVIEHRPSGRGRSVAPRVPALRLQNRIVLVRRHLPWLAGSVHLAAWTWRTFREARATGCLRPWRDALREGFSVPVQRRPLPWSILLRAHRSGGRVFW